MFYEHLHWKQVKAPHTSVLELLQSPDCNSGTKLLSHRKCTVDSIKRKHLSFYPVSAKLIFWNCHITVFPEWKSILLPILLLYKNATSQLKSLLIIGKLSHFIIFHQRPYHDTAVTVFLIISLLLFNSWLAEKFKSSQLFSERQYFKSTVSVKGQATQVW